MHLAGGSVTGGPDTGGLVGLNSGGSVTQSYWDYQATGQTTSEGGTGLSTTQMQGAAAQTNMTGFDFTNVWQTTPSSEAPIPWSAGGLAIAGGGYALKKLRDRKNQ